MFTELPDNLVDYLFKLDKDRLFQVMLDAIDEMQSYNGRTVTYCIMTALGAEEFEDETTGKTKWRLPALPIPIPKSKDFDVGDWVIYGMGIHQITKLEGRHASLTDGSIGSHGDILNNLRPLTIEAKRATESAQWQYKQLGKIAGQAGFNWPDIHRYFSRKVLEMIDNPKSTALVDLANFVTDAACYKLTIDGVPLFAPARG